MVDLNLNLEAKCEVAVFLSQNEIRINSLSLLCSRLICFEGVYHQQYESPACI